MTFAANVHCMHGVPVLPGERWKQKRRTPLCGLTFSLGEEQELGADVQLSNVPGLFFGF
jgi:hypothetical protein